MLQAVQLKLWEAAELGDAAEVHRCMQAGANAAVANRLGWNALHRACMSGSLQSIVHLLPSGSDEAAKVRATLLSTPDGAGYHPLHIAAGCGHSNVVQLLLKAGAQVDAPTAAPKEGNGGGDVSEMDTPMHTACKALADPDREAQVEQLLDVVVSLLSAGGLLEAQNAKGRMAVACLPQPMQKRLLERVKQPPAE